MSDEASFLAAIRAAPDDDLPRLVFADWLDDNPHSPCPACPTWEPNVCCDRCDPCHTCRGTGRVDPGRREMARFIRLQCRIAELERDCGCGGCVRNRGGGQHHNGPCAVDRERTGMSDGSSRQAMLRYQERTLWPLVWEAVVDAPTRSLLFVNDATSIEPTRVHNANAMVAVRRGFVETVRVSSVTDWLGGECWMCDGRGAISGYAAAAPPLPGQPFFLSDIQMTDHLCSECSGSGEVTGVGSALLARHPVQRVEVADREPAVVAGQWYWLRDDRDQLGFQVAPRFHLPSRVWDQLQWFYRMPPDRFRTKRYPTPEAALTALSTALITLAREEA